MTQKYYFLMLLCFLVPSLSRAEEPRLYQFEIIIFQYTNPNNTESETWPDKPGLPDNKNQLALITTKPPETDKAPATIEPAPVLSDYRTVNKEELLLNKEAEAVRRSSSRKLFLHAGWIQTMRPEETARPVALRLGDEYTTLVPDPAYDLLSPANNITTPAPAGMIGANIKPVNPDSPATDRISPATDPDITIKDTATPAADPELYSIPMIPQIVPQLEGTVTISIGRYLHVMTDLVFRAPDQSPVNPVVTSNNPEYTTLKSLRYQAHRRMRSKELHYIDNPSFGILIYAIPYK